jgi:hypothetical protein
MKRTETEEASIYRVNADNMIVSVNPGWIAFALQNHGSHLSPDAVMGQPLFRFIKGRDTQDLYQVIIERVRRSQDKAFIPFRCDGPSKRRFMKLEISSGANGQVQFTALTTREDERERVSLLDPLVNRTDECVLMCSWCKRVSVAGNWLNVELAVKHMELFNETSLPQITHGICIDCAYWVHRTIRSQKDTWKHN